MPLALATKELLDEVLSLPGETTAAMRVLRVLDTPDTSAADVGMALAADQALSTRAVFIANSSFYGRQAPVAGPAEAAATIGFETVRSLAAGVAFGLHQAPAGALPASFHRHSGAAAAAGSVLAEAVGMSGSDGFSIGMLHDIGSALLSIRRPAEASQMRADAERVGAPLHEIELARHGIHHATLGALALRSARFPERYVEAVLAHHRPIGTHDSPWTVLAVAADAAAHVLVDRVDDWPRSNVAFEECLVALDLCPFDAEDLLITIRHRSDELSGLLGA